MDNIMWGARRGLALAGVLSVLALILSVVNAEAFTKLGVPLPEVILLYAIGGVLGGGVGVAFYGAPSHWRRTDLASCLIYAVIMGIIGGNALWTQRAKSADGKLPM